MGSGHMSLIPIEANGRKSEFAPALEKILLG